VEQRAQTKRRRPVASVGAFPAFRMHVGRAVTLERGGVPRHRAPSFYPAEARWGGCSPRKRPKPGGE
jgi:hypothetical protein